MENINFDARATIFRNRTFKNITNRQQHVLFRKSLKVLYHSTLTYVLCTATRTKLEMKWNKWSCLQLWSFMTGSLEAEIYWFRLFLESASVTHNTFTKRCFDRGFLYLCWWLDFEQLAERKIILDLFAPYETGPRTWDTRDLRPQKIRNKSKQICTLEKVTSQDGPTNWSADRQREKKDMSGIHVWLILANPDRGNVFGSSWFWLKKDDGAHCATAALNS